MIVEPWNDRVCLRALHRQARALARSEAMREFAGQLSGLDALVTHIRGLPEREDLGAEMPRIACGEVTQRIRVMPPDPNCFERTLWYLAAAEILRPEGRRSSATAATDAGLHTFPVEDGDPVVLDVYTPANVLRAALDDIRALRGVDASLGAPERLLSWFWATARNACRTDDERRLVGQSERAFRNGLRIGRLKLKPAALDGVLGIAGREAGLWPDGREALGQVGKSLRKVWSSGALDPFVRAYVMTQLGPIAGPVALRAFDSMRAQQQTAEVRRLQQIVPRARGEPWQGRKGKPGQSSGTS